MWKEFDVVPRICEIKVFIIFLGNFLHDFKVLVGYDFDTKTKTPQLDDFSLCAEIKGKRRNGK